MQSKLGNTSSAFGRALRLFANCGFEYWLDSGSLLGLIRNGSEIVWDTDIDIGVWDSEVPAVLSSLKDWRREGYKVSSRRYRGQIYGFTVEDRREFTFRPIHIHVYFRSGDIAWSPQTVSYAPVAREFATVGFARGDWMRCLLTQTKHGAQQRRIGSFWQRAWGNLVCYPVWGVVAALRSRLDREYWVSLWPYSTIYAMYTWIIPAHYFTRLAHCEFEGICVPIPSDVEDYLTLRYGDWCTPVSDWCYWTDDGCIYPERPEVALNGRWRSDG